MGLKNYLYDGTYTNIGGVSYHKNEKRVVVHTKTVSPDGEPVTNQTFVCDGNHPCTEIDGRITTEEGLRSFLDSLSQGGAEATYLVQLVSEEFLGWNNLLVSNVGGELRQHVSPYIYEKSTAKYFEFNGSTWFEPRTPNCSRYFDKHFSLSKLSSYPDFYAMGYAYIKKLPEFSNCVDC